MINHTWPMGLYERLKMSLMAVTLFPVRVVALLLVTLATNLFCRMIVFGNAKVEGTRRQLCGIMIPIFSRLIAMCFGYWYIPVKVYSSEF